MTITVEDGTVITDANSYASEADLEAYADLRGVVITADGEVLLIKAMDALAGRNWKGDRKTTTQELAWPRYGVYRDNQLLPSDEIPRELFYGQMALAIAAQTTDLTPTQTANEKGPVIEERVEGVVTRKYANPGRVLPVAAVADAEALLKVLEHRAGLSVVRA